ncbi:MAG: protein phosphatase 2C domain-containing protein [Methylococcaceae bacterium]|nr:MAG: protein phosphatase 2C domain-containing protein [Methylococcaceae bacterium]
MSENVWRTWGASVIGPLHSKRNIPNQDAWIARQYTWGDVVVVADGLGSRAKSDIGSQAVCQSVLEAAKTFQRCPNAKIEDILRLIHAHWLIKISPFDTNECLTTCLFVIRYHDRCLLAQLGDGLIAVCGRNNEESILMNDSKLENFSNQTHSIGKKFILEQWQTRIISMEAYHAVVLCTDGISDDLLPEAQIDFAQDFSRSYCNYPSLKRTVELRGWLKNWSVPGHTDDKTIACLIKKDVSLNYE